jgi:hypothetical protein
MIDRGVGLIRIKKLSDEQAFCDEVFTLSKKLVAQAQPF